MLHSIQIQRKMPDFAEIFRRLAEIRSQTNYANYVNFDGVCLFLLCAGCVSRKDTYLIDDSFKWLTFQQRPHRPTFETIVCPNVICDFIEILDKPFNFCDDFFYFITFRVNKFIFENNRTCIKKFRFFVVSTICFCWIELAAATSVKRTNHTNNVSENYNNTWNALKSHFTIERISS